MVGCDVERGPELRHWSSIALQAFSGDPAVMPDVVVAIRELRRFADELIEDKQRTPGDDLTSALVRAVDDGDLALDDVRSLLTELLSASVDNTTHSMGLAVWLLAAHPDEWSAVARGAAPLDRAVEECARFEPVIRHGNHVATRDVELLGVDGSRRHPGDGVPGVGAPGPGGLRRIPTGSTPRAPRNRNSSSASGVTTASAPRSPAWRSRRSCGAVTTRWGPPRIGAGARVETAVTGEVHALPVEFDALGTGSIARGSSELAATNRATDRGGRWRCR